MKYKLCGNDTPIPKIMRKELSVAIYTWLSSRGVALPPPEPRRQPRLQQRRSNNTSLSLASEEPEMMSRRGQGGEDSEESAGEQSRST
jgi:hypothetical protein